MYLKYKTNHLKKSTKFIKTSARLTQNWSKYSNFLNQECKKKQHYYSFRNEKDFKRYSGKFYVHKLDNLDKQHFYRSKPLTVIQEEL